MLNLSRLCALVDYERPLDCNRSSDGVRHLKVDRQVPFVLFFVDEIFLLKDPRELWTHWSEEVWQKIEAHQIEPGMSEYQVVFALGAGNIIEATMHSTVRIVDYKLGREAGITPVRVTYRDGAVERVRPLPED